MKLALEDHLQQLTVLHPTLCPRQVLGVRMARLACEQLRVDPAIERKMLFVNMEIGRCTADAVMVVTTATPTNGLMRLMDYGKVAATFVNRCTGRAMRIAEHPDSRAAAIAMLPSLPVWEAQRDAYQIMPDAQLLRWQWVKLNFPLPTIPEKHSVRCERCGDRVNEHQEVEVGGEILCKPCAFGAYFTVEDHRQKLNPLAY